MTKTQTENPNIQMEQSRFLKIWKRYIDLLCCPDCANQDMNLVYKYDSGKEALICNNCHSEFPIINSIPILLPKRYIGKVGIIKKSIKTNPEPSEIKDGNKLETLVDWKYLSFQYYTRFCEFKKSLVSLQPNDIVLDIGCAGGSIASGFSNYIGLDNSWKLISFARRHLDKPFVLADAQAIPFKTKSTDYVISRNLLEHTTNDREIMKEICRICRLKGIFELPCSDGVSFLIDPINTMRIKMGVSPRPFFSYGFGHINMQTEKEWEKRLTENGFDIIEKQYLGRGIIFKLVTFLEFLLFSFGDNDDIPTRLIGIKILQFIHPVYGLIYKLDPKTRKSWSRIFVVAPNKRYRIQ